MFLLRFDVVTQFCVTMMLLRNDITMPHRPSYNNSLCTKHWEYVQSDLEDIDVSLLNLWFQREGWFFSSRVKDERLKPHLMEMKLNSSTPDKTITPSLIQRPKGPRRWRLTRRLVNQRERLAIDDHTRLTAVHHFPLSVSVIQPETVRRDEQYSERPVKRDS